MSEFYQAKNGDIFSPSSTLVVRKTPPTEVKELSFAHPKLVTHVAEGALNASGSKMHPNIGPGVLLEAITG